jgi:hypothetical protein
MSYQRIDRRGKLHGYSGTATDAVVHEVALDRERRWRRAGLALATWWVVAFGCVFIPIAHLVLVPGFLGYGIYSAVHRLKLGRVVTGVEGTCPDCGYEQIFDVPEAWSPADDLACAKCRRSLTFTPDRG